MARYVFVHPTGLGNLPLGFSYYGRGEDILLCHGKKSADPKDKDPVGRAFALYCLFPGAPKDEFDSVFEKIKTEIEPHTVAFVYAGSKATAPASFDLIRRLHPIVAKVVLVGCVGRENTPCCVSEKEHLAMELGIEWVKTSCESEFACIQILDDLVLTK